MNSSLPNPKQQVGLKGYYTFDNLENKQGNPKYNGTLNGAAKLKAINPNCTFIADSCSVNVPVVSVIPPPKINFDFKVSNCNMVHFQTTQRENLKNYSWEIENKVINNKTKFTYTFSKDGNYKVILKATGLNGKKIAVEKMVSKKKLILVLVM